MRSVNGNLTCKSQPASKDEFNLALAVGAENFRRYIEAIRSTFGTPDALARREGSSGGAGNSQDC